MCKRNFSRHGISVTLMVTDNGSNFTSEAFRKFVLDWEIVYTFSSPHHRKANGKAESAVKIVKQLTGKSVDGGIDFYKSLFGELRQINLNVVLLKSCIPGKLVALF